MILISPSIGLIISLNKLKIFKKSVFFYSHQNVNENYLQKFLVLGEKKEIRNCQILPTIYCAKIIDNFRC